MKYSIKSAEKMVRMQLDGIISIRCMNLMNIISPGFFNTFYKKLNEQ